jgi:hypothetical protein
MLAFSFPLYLHVLQRFPLYQTSIPHYIHKILFHLPIHHPLPFFLNYQIHVCTEIKEGGSTTLPFFCRCTVLTASTVAIVGVTDERARVELYPPQQGEGKVGGDH